MQLFEKSFAKSLAAVKKSRNPLLQHYMLFISLNTQEVNIKSNVQGLVFYCRLWFFYSNKL